MTTSLRFHPLEILLSMGIKLAVALALGPPAVAALIFEVLLNATAMFNHSNIRLPRFVDRFFRLIVVTPDIYRVHHSIRPEETNSNFGFNLPGGTVGSAPTRRSRQRGTKDDNLDRAAPDKTGPLTRPDARSAGHRPAGGYPINRKTTKKR
ncbi:sterol desaturase family protein [Gymnodinialimonas ceratoperidinii]|uniref:sterol desaturase family protein n=1 Tax=Gymnodinialimonas ceratoperidinii TaxID=2856823 RepID=UPI001FFD800D|nr:sterol desaturase family protein [Gymnodinialimonas ceratoperidinii]